MQFMTDTASTKRYVCALSRVPTAGIFDKRLLLVDTCHAVGAVHLQQYRPLLCCPLAVSQCDTTVWNLQGLLAGTSRLVVFPRLVYTWQSVDTASDQVRESWERDNNDQSDIWQVYANTDVRQIDRLWKQRDSYALGFL